MQVNADKLLQDALAKDENLREEWLLERKLRCDPRVTRVGKFLRKTSLDELPQFWNVWRGEMSLVGPRPIVEEEIPAYGPNFSLYCRVTPGLTGLWQVSGRSEVSRRDRVRLDSYYVRNWSPWLDLNILARTAIVVLSGRLASRFPLRGRACLNEVCRVVAENYERYAMPLLGVKVLLVLWGADRLFWSACDLSPLWIVAERRRSSLPRRQQF